MFIVADLVSLKKIEVYSPLGIWQVFLCSINTNIYHFRSMNSRHYAYIPANRHIHLPVCKTSVANSVNPDQTDTLEAVGTGSTLFVCMPKSILNVSIYMQQMTFSDAFFS